MFFFKRHLFHLVNKSPWPLFVGIFLFFVTSGLVFFFHRIVFGGFVFFFGFFWAFFHASLSPAFIFAGEWPQPGIVAVFPLGFPFFNTLLLIISGVVVTMVHRAIALALSLSV